ncbi:MAG: type III-A CRISPR-associated RAMP protein Csm5 [Desulfobacterales bacterium]
MTTYRFKAYALTPIHVGCGREIDPTEFVLADDKLFHVNIAALVNDLAPMERERFSQFLDRADLKEMQNFLRHQARGGRHILGQVDAGKAFLNEFATKASSPNNQFRVEMMPRNPYTGDPILPGSGIKGAIRTAVINYFANVNPRTAAEVQRIKNIEIKKRGQVLEEAALARQHRDTHRDVFRLVHVEDVALPRGSTRIDRAANINPNKPGAEKIQMWVERLKSQADMPSPPIFEVKVRIDTRSMKDPRLNTLLGRTLDLDLICGACNKFYWGRMTEEGDKFDKRSQNGASWQAIYNLFPKARFEDGKTVTLDPISPYWENRELKRKRVLLRMGHFSHFESLSVDNYRQGFNIQAKRPITGMGSTRTRCVMENKSFPMPFGWLIMTLDADGITEP